MLFSEFSSFSFFFMGRYVVWHFRYSSAFHLMSPSNISLYKTTLSFCFLCDIVKLAFSFIKHRFSRIVTCCVFSYFRYARSSCRAHDAQMFCTPYFTQCCTQTMMTRALPARPRLLSISNATHASLLASGDCASLLFGETNWFYQDDFLAGDSRITWRLDTSAYNLLTIKFSSVWISRGVRATSLRAPYRPALRSHAFCDKRACLSLVSRRKRSDARWILLAYHCLCGSARGTHAHLRHKIQL